MINIVLLVRVVKDREDGCDDSLRLGNNSQLSGILGFDSKIFCVSEVLTTLETASKMHKIAEFYEAE